MSGSMRLVAIRDLVSDEVDRYPPGAGAGFYVFSEPDRLGRAKGVEQPTDAAIAKSKAKVPIRSQGNVKISVVLGQRHLRRAFWRFVGSLAGNLRNHAVAKFSEVADE